MCTLVWVCLRKCYIDADSLEVSPLVPGGYAERSLGDELVACEATLSRSYGS